MANSKFKAAVKKAKTLYKSGRYKSFASAVKAAYKKRPTKKRRAVAKISRIAKKVGTRSTRKRHAPMTEKKRVELQLGRVMVEHWRTQSIKRTKELDRQKAALKKRLRSL